MPKKNRVTLKRKKGGMPKKSSKSPHDDVDIVTLIEIIQDNISSDRINIRELNSNIKALEQLISNSDELTDNERIMLESLIESGLKHKHKSLFKGLQSNKEVMDAYAKENSIVSEHEDGFIGTRREYRDHINEMTKSEKKASKIDEIDRETERLMNEAEKEEEDARKAKASWDAWHKRQQIKEDEKFALALPPTPKNRVSRKLKDSITAADTLLAHAADTLLAQKLAEEEEEDARKAKASWDAWHEQQKTKKQIKDDAELALKLPPTPRQSRVSRKLQKSIELDERLNQIDTDAAIARALERDGGRRKTMRKKDKNKNKRRK